MTRVLVVGRFAPAEAGCGRTTRRCGEAFVVERFAWADGVRVAPDAAHRGSAPDRHQAREPVRRGPPRAELPLAAVLAWPDGIARLDPKPPPSPPPGPPASRSGTCGSSRTRRARWAIRLVRWMLLADRDFGVIGSGRVPVTTADAAAGMIVQRPPRTPWTGPRRPASGRHGSD